MIFLSANIARTSVFSLVILTLTVNVYAGRVGASGEKTLNIKIGFDLTQGSNGPSLRIRDFEDSKEAKPRADDGGATPVTEPSPRASSSKSSEQENKGDVVASPKRDHDGEDSDNKSDSDNDYSGSPRYSTRGLNPEEYEPEERTHEVKLNKPVSSESDNNKSNRRRKRSIIIEADDEDVLVNF